MKLRDTSHAQLRRARTNRDLEWDQSAGFSSHARIISRYMLFVERQALDASRAVTYAMNRAGGESAYSSRAGCSAGPSLLATAARSVSRVSIEGAHRETLCQPLRVSAPSDPACEGSS